MADRSEFIKFFITLATLTMLLTSHITTASESTFTPACDEQPETKQLCPFELPNVTIEKLKIDAGFGWGIFNGSIYNGNSEYIITQLIVSMTPVHDHHHMEMMGDMHDMPHETRIHHINMNLMPLTKGAISKALDDDVVHVHDFEWKVLKAFGHKVQ